MDFFSIEYLPMEDALRKKDGFRGQKAIVIPRSLLAGRSSGGRAAGGLYITDIGYYPRARFHYVERPKGIDQHIIIYCHDGVGFIETGTAEYRVNPGEFFFIPAKTPHAYRAEENNAWTIYWIHFKGPLASGLADRLSAAANGKGVVHSAEKSIAIFNDMYAQLERGYSNDTLMYINMCFWHYLASLVYNSKAAEPAANSKGPVDAAIDFLSGNVSRMVSLQELARQANLSPAHFAVVFKKNTGFRPMEYFNQLKVQKACQYLLFTNLRIKEIALALGMDDQYYFSRLFAKVMGMAPNHYREKHHPKA